MSDRPTLPAISSLGELLPSMSSRRRHEIVDLAFEMGGGVERLAHCINKSDDTFMDFVKSVWSKGLPRAVAVEHSVSDSVDALLDRLDAGEHADVIEGEATEV